MIAQSNPDQRHETKSIHLLKYPFMQSLRSQVITTFLLVSVSETNLG